MQHRNSQLAADARQHTLIAAHRGAAGGNVPCNTLAAFDAALYSGADMVELDVGRSRDGTLYVFHEGCERAHLGLAQPFSTLTDDQVRQLRYLNQDLTPTEYPVVPLEEAFRHLKGRCYINVDKFARYMAPIAQAIRRQGMAEQAVVKTDGTPQLLSQVEATAPELNYIAILRERDDCTQEALKRPIRYIGVEALFTTEAAPICQQAYLQRMHDMGLILWCNAIVYDYRQVLSAGHSDDLSVTGRPAEGWGWLLAQGFDIIQTDWPLQLRRYLAQAGRPSESEGAYGHQRL